MDDISIIFIDNAHITIEEFRLLENNAIIGRLWTLIHRPTQMHPNLIRQRTVEYILDPETLTFLTLISRNILARWPTQQTLHLPEHSEFQLSDSLFIKPYPVTL